MCDWYVCWNDVFPYGVLAGPFIGALLGELLFAKRSVDDAAFGAAGALVGFVFGTLLKVVVCIVMSIWVVKAFFKASRTRTGSARSYLQVKSYLHVRKA